MAKGTNHGGMKQCISVSCDFETFDKINALAVDLARMDGGKPSFAAAVRVLVKKGIEARANHKETI